MAPPGDVTVLEWHERRISDLEKALTTSLAANATTTAELRAVQTRLGELTAALVGFESRVTEALGEIVTRVDQQGESLAVIARERESRKVLRRRVGRVVAYVLAPLTAAAAAFGGDLYRFLKARFY